MNETPQHPAPMNELILGALAGRVIESTEVARTDKALINIGKDSLYFPVLYEAEEVGGVFLGKGSTIVDAIVETRQGAIGKSEDRQWDGSLLLLTRSNEWTPPSVSKVSDNDFKRLHLASAEESQERAQTILTTFQQGDRCWFTEWFIRKGQAWQAIILDKDHGKTHIIAKKDHIILQHADEKLVLTDKRMVRKKGNRKTLVAGRHGPIIQIG